jgi:formylglycine-generating enzyme
MGPLQYAWGPHSAIEMVFVQGTHGRPVTFGEATQQPSIEIADFFIATVPVTDDLWAYVMDAHDERSVVDDGWRAKVDVSWDDITKPDGFLDRMNTSSIQTSMLAQASGYNKALFRLPSETEWEYAARGGPHWPDGFRFSGSDDIDAVAWYERNSGDRTHNVAQKAPNQLGIYDMCGNVWEWCQDSFTRDISSIPTDGSAVVRPAEERILRGGCYHNWAMHCTVSKRYEIARAYHDGCIGFRLTLSAARNAG